MSKARLICLTAARDEFLIEQTIEIGRDVSNHVRIDSSEVSRKHAVILANPGEGFVLSDVGSTNGTLVNDRAIRTPIRLRSEDVLTFGSMKFKFLEEADLDDLVSSAEDGGQTTQAGSVRRDAILIGRSPAMNEVYRLIAQASESDIPVLIHGETGTGKELVAAGVHASSRRVAKPFKAINCANLSESLIEAMLFGHRRGAFTGAIEHRPGIFELADGGTLFLDEIGEMPLAMQPKLLRVLQDGELTRIGDSVTRRVNVRIVSASNRDLAADVREGRFRADLYFRLSAFPIHVPPLRERREDIPALCEFFLASFAKRYGSKLRQFTPEALETLQRFSWPGNVRELRNEIERIVTAVRTGDTVRNEHLVAKVFETDPAPHAEGSTPPSSEPRHPSGDSIRQVRSSSERQHIIDVLARERYVVTRTAAVLGISRQSLYKKLQTYGIEVKPPRGRAS